MQLLWRKGERSGDSKEKKNMENGKSIFLHDDFFELPKSYVFFFLSCELVP